MEETRLLLLTSRDYFDYFDLFDSFTLSFRLPLCPHASIGADVASVFNMFAFFIKSLPISNEILVVSEEVESTNHRVSENTRIKGEHRN